MDLQKNQQENSFAYKITYAEENQYLEKPGFREEDRLAASHAYDETKAEQEKRAKKYLEEKESDLKKLEELEEGRLFTDRISGEIPYETKKKLKVFKRKETEEEYRDRIKKKIENRYNYRKKETDANIREAEQRKNYYEKDDSVNRVDLDQVRNTRSEETRKAMKQALLAMSRADAGKYEKGHPLCDVFDSFMESIKAYAEQDGHQYQYRGEDYNMLLDEGKYMENIAFRKMKKALAELKKAGAEQKDTALLFSLKNYDSLFSAMADGQLQVPEGTKTIQLKGEFVTKTGKKTHFTDQSRDPLFAHEPSISDITQGYLGDCYLMSAAGVMASIEPQLIKEMMKDNGTTVTVKLYKPVVNLEGTDPLFISEPLYIEVPKKSADRHGSKNALWVNALELAYTKYVGMRDITKNSVAELKKTLESGEGTQLDNKVKEFEEEYRNKLKEHHPNISRKDARECEKWYVNAAIEKYISGKSYGAKYENIKKKVLDAEENGPVNVQKIAGGLPSRALSVMTGRIHSSSDLGVNSQKDIEMMNSLSFIFDDIMENVMKPGELTELESARLEEEIRKSREEQGPVLEEYGKLKDQITKIREKRKTKKLTDEEEKEYRDIEAKAKEYQQRKNSLAETIQKENRIKPMREVEEMAKDVLRRYLEKYSCSFENKAEGSSIHKSFMSKEQLTKLLESAKKDKLPDDVLALLTEEEKKKLVNYGSLKPESVIKRTMEQYMNFFLANAEKNTVLNYEMFSGKYSVQGEKIFEKIREAISKKQAVTASTYELSTDVAIQEEETEEYVFDGIASTHAYMVTGTKVVKEEYQENGETKTREIKYVRVKNPWSGTHLTYEKKDGKTVPVQHLDDSTEGVSEIELNHFMSRFYNVTSAAL